MEYLVLIAYAFGGIFFVNGIPHIVKGVSGAAFQTPFAKPAGVGLSSSTLNVLWGFANLYIAYVLMLVIGDFEIRNWAHAMAFGLGMLLIGLILAKQFGRLHGGELG